VWTAAYLPSSIDRTIRKDREELLFGWMSRLADNKFDPNNKYNNKFIKYFKYLSIA